MAEIRTPDLCIIGAGAAGLAAAMLAQRYEASVILVERQRMGGRLLDAGALPARVLGEAARRAQDIREAGRLGIGGGEPQISFRQVHDALAAAIGDAEAEVSLERIVALGIDIVGGDAAFRDRRTLAVGELLIRPRRFIIATGARPVIPAIPGIGTIPYFTVDTVFDNIRKFTHLVVLGGGAEALEFAQAYRRLGSEVTLVAPGPLLPEVDPELSSIALRRLADEGVVLRPETPVLSINARSMGIGVVVASGPGEETLDASHVLIAGPRAPDLSSLDIEKAGLIAKGQTEPSIAADSTSANPRILFAGEASGQGASLHLARLSGEYAARRALFGRFGMSPPPAVPRVVHIDPAIAEIGASEAAARKSEGGRFVVTRVSPADNGRARAERDGLGLAKLITARNGRILGAGLVGPGAGELASILSYAIARGLKAEELAGFVSPWPAYLDMARALAEQLEPASRLTDARRRLALMRRLP